MPEIVTLATAKAHGNLTDEVNDADLQLKLDIAHALVLDYVNQRRSGAEEWNAEVQSWTENTALLQVVGAILYQFRELCRYRGDDEAADLPKRDAVLSPLVRAMLDRLRDPAVA
jgi:hypothetical protein